MFESPPFWMYFVGFLLVLGPLVTIHELGHYLVGRWFGVGAEAFSIGFGKEIYGWTDRRGTRWKLSAIPLGGYVQFKGDMNAASQPDPDIPVEPGSFQSAELWKRALIVFAGPATNLLLTFGIFASFFLVLGEPKIIFPENSTEVGRFAEESVARDAGVEVGDKIVAIDGQEITNFEQILKSVQFYPGRDIVLGVERDGASLDIPLSIGSAQMTDGFGNESTVGRIGIYSAATDEVAIDYNPVGPGTAISLAGQEIVNVTYMMVTGIKQIFAGDRSIKELGGPIKIAKYSGEQLSLGLKSFVWFAALISLNLAFINLLPIPALDGGHLAFYAAEAIRRKPVGPRGQEWAYRMGISLVLVLMVFVTVNDLVSLPIFGS